MKAYGFPGDAIVKNPPVNIRDKRDTSLIPELGRSPRERNGIPLQCSCLENSMDRGTWSATVHGVGLKESDTAEQAQEKSGMNFPANPKHSFH